MINFTVERIEQFETTVKVYRLYRGDRCKYLEFRDDIKGTNLEPELGDLYAIVRKVANGERLPPSSYKRLSKLSSKLKFSGWEAKSDNLRLYLIHHNGVILILGGKKGEQDEDTETLEKTIKEYTEFINKKPK